MKMSFAKISFMELLEHSYAVEASEIAKEFKDADEVMLSRFAWLSDHIFDFTTYDSEISDLFGRKACEVCAAINNRKTFEFIEDVENYKWYLLMCNMPFFEKKLSWGGSIRGAWWDHGEQMELNSCGLYFRDKQITETLKFNPDSWGKFIAAVLEFSQKGGSE